MMGKHREGNLSTWKTRGMELITGAYLEMRGMCEVMCICGNVRGKS